MSIPSTVSVSANIHNAVSILKTLTTFLNKHRVVGFVAPTQYHADNESRPLSNPKRILSSIETTFFNTPLLLNMSATNWHYFWRERET